MRILLAGGGTGGHLYPGVALAQALRELDPAGAVRFLCTDKPLDRDALARYGFDARPLVSPRWEGVRRSGLSFLPRMIGALRRAAREQREFAPDVTVGLGGYGELAPALAAGLSGVPLALLEQNVLPGKATRLAARWASAIFLQWEASRARLPRGARARCAAPGNPVRREMAPVPRAEALARAGFDPATAGATRVLAVLGGSQGARALNRWVTAAADGWTGLAGRVSVIHLTGKQDCAEVAAAYARAGVTARVAEFSDDMPAVYGAADLVVARAGGTTLAELTALGVPSILVPYPHAAEDHQMLNAQEAERAGAAVLWPEADLAARAAGPALEAVLLDAGRMAALRAGAQRLGRPDAAREIARRVLELGAARAGGQDSALVAR
ncbi:MAG: UDP-N-acetylglucosamine--N-acetylmuramyl-(pentapeptide) pyrophosphoryl-undecaprenol N-acetylglucosamine transferase [Planctomycetes bacterium]|nr:UDP-N-acetylglucosamine--N-acetylmuramyl-(pentapeptide) pyrophosphoryl-undecaprenol N-acetylglucosamine transferase [Planctomycetota bacterium]